jgi:hypothetical protein
MKLNGLHITRGKKMTATVSLQKVRGIATRNGIGYVDKVRSRYASLAKGITVKKGYEGTIVRIYGQEEPMIFESIKNTLFTAFDNAGFTYEKSTVYPDSWIVKAGN